MRDLDGKRVVGAGGVSRREKTTVLSDLVGGREQGNVILRHSVKTQKHVSIKSNVIDHVEICSDMRFTGGQSDGQKHLLSRHKDIS